MIIELLSLYCWKLIYQEGSIFIVVSSFLFCELLWIYPVVRGEHLTIQILWKSVRLLVTRVSPIKEV